MSDTTPTDQLAAPTAHLTPELWAAAGRHLVRKGLAEFSHERLLKPEPLPGAEPDAERRTAHRVVTDDGVTEYRFAAKLLSLDHWDIAADSITRHGEGGTELPWTRSTSSSTRGPRWASATPSSRSTWRRSPPPSPAPPGNWPRPVRAPPSWPAPASRPSRRG